MITTLPQPVVEWMTVLQSFEPLKEASRARYRTLLKHGVTSKGLTVAVRRKGHLAGKRTFHSVLAALAVRAEQTGDIAGAAYLGKEASLLEARYASVLTAFLARHTTDELPVADFYAPLVKATSEALRHWGRLADLVFAAGVLAETDQDSAHIEAVTRDGTAIDLLLPRLLIEEQGITAGDPVLVFRRLVGHAAVVDVLRGLTVEQTESGEIELSLSKAHTITDSQLTAAQPTEAEVAKRYESGPGALLSEADLSRLAGVARGKTARRIKILG